MVGLELKQVFVNSSEFNIRVNCFTFLLNTEAGISLTKEFNGTATVFEGTFWLVMSYKF